MRSTAHCYSGCGLGEAMGVTIAAGIYLAGEATIGDPVFWASLAVSLSIGFLAAYPINLALLHFGVKEGMGNPAA
ncbi:DUF4396 domain-containing protein [Halolamina sp.]|jgi:hypothetical protein|uniref:DUF4396 domain-containing protein n=1 Tax=Halolamina sp. TaxID=1940283 RepID=UPI000677CD33